MNFTRKTYYDSTNTFTTLFTDISTQLYKTYKLNMIAIHTIFLILVTCLKNNFIIKQKCIVTSDFKGAMSSQPI